MFLALLLSAEVQSAGPGASTHDLPLFTPSGDIQQGFARIINQSNRSGTVRIHGTDDAGRRYGPVTLSLNARATRHFNSGDLEEGNAAKGLSGRLGDGEGDWRLHLQTDLDIEAGAYIRTPDGFLASVHDVVRTVESGGGTEHQVPIFNPGSNRKQVSWLRIANLDGRHVNVTIRGRDDAGRSAPGGDVRLVLSPNGARRISAQQIESGGTGLTGRLGDGKGKWQLFVTADGAIEVASLMQTPTGHLTNLSVSGLGREGVSRQYALPLFPSVGQGQQGFARIINRSNRAGTVRIHATDESGRWHGPITLSLDARATRHFNSGDLEGGNASKGLSGGLGDGAGDWRLELTTDLDIDPSAYIRASDGFLTAMHAVARTADVGGETVHQVPLFNPGSNRKQVSRLRVANLENRPVVVTIEGRDDAGRPAPGAPRFLHCRPERRWTSPPSSSSPANTRFSAGLATGRESGSSPSPPTGPSRW